MASTYPLNGPAIALEPANDAADVRHVLEIDHVSLSFTAARGVPLSIIRDISLNVRAGEFVTMVGPSGCGKSSLLNLVAELLPASSGTVKIREPSDAASGAKLGYMFQTDGLLPWRNVIDNVALGLELQGVASKERYVKALDILDRLGLRDFLHHLPSELSGGMRQRVALARMWILDPQLLLMDEPFGALDAQTRLLVQDLFVAYWEKAKNTVIFVTHDIDEAILLADRVVVLSAQPASVKAIYDVDLPRPRRRFELRQHARFNELWESIWGDLRADATRALEAV